MIRFSIAVIALAWLTCRPQPVSAALITTFDFENLSLSSMNDSLTVSEGGLVVEITRESGTPFDMDDTGTVAFGSRSLSPFNGQNGAAADDWFVFNLSQPVTAISLALGDFGGDGDNLFLQAFTERNLQGQVRYDEGALIFGGDQFGYQTLEVQADTVATSFQSFRTIGGEGSWPNSVYYDNFAFQTTAVPEPSACHLIAAGLVSVGGWRARGRARKSRAS